MSQEKNSSPRPSNVPARSQPAVPGPSPSSVPVSMPVPGDGASVRKGNGGARP